MNTCTKKIINVTVALTMIAGVTFSSSAQASFFGNSFKKFKTIPCGKSYECYRPKKTECWPTHKPTIIRIKTTGL